MTKDYDKETFLRLYPFMFFLLNYNQYKSFFYSLTTLDWKEIGVPKSQNGLIAKNLIFHQKNCEFGGILDTLLCSITGRWGTSTSGMSLVQGTKSPGSVQQPAQKRLIWDKSNLRTWKDWTIVRERRILFVLPTNPRCLTIWDFLQCPRSRFITRL